MLADNVSLTLRILGYKDTCSTEQGVQYFDLDTVLTMCCAYVTSFRCFFNSRLYYHVHSSYIMT